ncbi:helix-turn-helix transcriptional regulator [Filimonas effusa]|uniref:AraC family transcriptional regulator n=1 Tax=Filimonas effusa TaxID=2508721 RepID=A0A4V1M9V1_9BACT|nr:AraC family transcriptional regulator [Filimonas effusa]RXK82954.1 AraC family transcriptional regulator [Filimonas effusa]
MKSVFHSKDFRELMVVKELPDNFACTGSLSQHSYNIDYNGIHGHVNEMLINGFLVVHRVIHSPHEIQILTEHDFPFLKMQFELKGHSAYQPAKPGSLAVDIPEGTHNLFFFPAVKGRLNYPTTERFTLEIMLSVNWLQHVFNGDLSSLKQFGYAIDHTQPAVMGVRSGFITPVMKQAILSIIHCPYTGILKKIYVESKVQELLVLQIEHFSNASIITEAAPARTVIKQGDTEKFHYVKELINNNLQEPCSLIRLAELAGMNDFKLKKGFKELFGTTVFGYMTEVRMNKAKSLLLEGKHTISDISWWVGYKNPQHFTAAFKRKFGYLPSELKK